MIKVIIVDDSNFMRKVIRELLSFDKSIEIIAEYTDGKDLLENLSNIKPDVIIMDIVMKTIDGLWALETVHKKYTTPVIIFSSISSNNSDIEKDAFLLGAFDVIHKPSSGKFSPEMGSKLIQAIKNATGNQNGVPKTDSAENSILSRIISSRKIIAIGSSAGGPPAVKLFLSLLPADLPASIIIAQHMPENFIVPFSVHLAEVTKLSVKIAEDGDILSFGKVYISPVSTTLTISKLRRGCVIKLMDVDTRLKPSINIMLNSAADAAKMNTIGIIFSGMGDDGVEGLKAIKRFEGKTFAQDQRTSIVYGMPKAAALSGFTDNVLPPEKIAEEIINLLKFRKE